MDDFRAAGRRALLRGCAAGRDRGGGRHAGLCLFDGDDAPAGRGAAGRAGPLPDPLIAYAVKANPNSAVIATLAKAGLGADVVSGGEYRARDRGGRAGGQDRLLRRRQDRRRDAPRAGRRAVPVQPRIARRSRDAVGRGDGDGPHRAQSASASTPTSPRAAMPRSRPAPPRTSSASRSATRPTLMLGPRRCRASGPGRRGPYRQPADHLEPLERAFTRVGELIGELRAAGHEITRRRSRRRSRRSLRSRPAAAAEPGRLWRDGQARRGRLERAAGVRARPADRRQCRRPAVARHPREARRDRSVRHRRRGDERPDAPRAL